MLQQKQKLWPRFRVRATEELTWMVWLLMVNKSASAILVMMALIAPIMFLTVLPMLTGKFLVDHAFCFQVYYVMLRYYYTEWKASEQQAAPFVH